MSCSLLITWHKAKNKILTPNRVGSLKLEIIYKIEKVSNNVYHLMLINGSIHWSIISHTRRRKCMCNGWQTLDERFFLWFWHCRVSFFGFFFVCVLGGGGALSHIKSECHRNMTLRTNDPYFCYMLLKSARVSWYFGESNSLRRAGDRLFNF